MLRRSLILSVLAAFPAAADPPVIDAVEVTQTGDTWRFDVTISHADTGWDHYADGWDILTPDGERLGFRELYHPHVEEQPFTRSLNNVEIPDGLDSVILRARCSVTGWSEPQYTVSIPR